MKPSFVASLLYGALALIAMGCTEQPSATPVDPRMSQLALQVERLEQRVKALEDARQLQELLADFRQIAYLKPGDSGYSLVDFDLGRLTVQLEDVKPFANGTKVTLRFGNIGSAAVEGIRARIEYGSVDEKGSPKNESTRQQEVSFVKTFRPGSWTTVSVNLEGIQPAQLGFIRVRDIGYRAIGLSGR